MTSTVCHVGLQNSLPVKQFLQNCAAVISREPKVFLEAVLAPAPSRRAVAGHW